LGFSYRGIVDPFDTGPHLEADTDKVSLVNQTKLLTLGKPTNADRCTSPVMLSTMNEDAEFRALECLADLETDGVVRITRAVMEALMGAPGTPVGMTPMDAWTRGDEVRIGERSPEEPDAAMLQANGVSKPRRRQPEPAKGKAKAKGKSRRVRS
jgi:hypothetical protein